MYFFDDVLSREGNRCISKSSVLSECGRRLTLIGDLENRRALLEGINLEIDYLTRKIRLIKMPDERLNYGAKF